MKLTKKTLATAVAATLFSTGASAAIDIDAPAAPAVYASELAFTSGTLTLTNAATNLDVTGILNANVILGGHTVAIKFTLGNGATFSSAVSSTALTLTSAGTKTVNSGGAVGDNFVEFLYIPTAATAATDTFTFVIPAVKVTSTSPVSVSYEAKNVTTGNTVVKSKSNVALLDFDKALSFSCIAGSPDKVDVTQNSNFFAHNTGDVDSDLGSVDLTHTARLNASSVATTLNGILASGSLKLTNASGWAAFDQTNGVVEVDNNDATIATNDATLNYAAAAASGIFAFTDLSGAQVLLTVPADNAVAIASGAVSAAFSGVANTGYNDFAETCDVAAIAKNGSEASLDFLTGTSSSYPSYIRITNPSGIDGTVYLTITDDAGAKAELKLSDFGLSEELAKGTSTGNLKVSDVAAKAAEANPAFNATTSRYRVVANGEFSNIKMQAWAVANDGTSFELLK